MPALTNRSRLTSAMPGRLLAAAVLLGSASAGLAYSEDPARMWDAVGRAGFDLREMRLKGQKETSDSAIIAAVGLTPGATLLGVDVNSARERLEALPWVRSATVRKDLPHTLSVEIEEASAFARWRWRGDEVLIAADGTVLADDVPFAFRDLPLVAGRGANMAVREIRAVLDAHPSFDDRTAAAIFVNERRWDLRLDNGATVRLPAEDASRSLLRLAALEEEGAILGVGRVVIDMRLPDRTTVQLKVEDSAEDDGERPQLSHGATPADPLAAAIAEATIVYDDPLARAISEAMIP